MNFDPVKFVRETLLRVRDACEMNFDQLTRHLAYLLTDHALRMKFDPLLHCSEKNFDPFLKTIIGTKMDQSSFRMHIEHLIRSPKP